MTPSPPSPTSIARPPISRCRPNSTCTTSAAPWLVSPRTPPRSPIAHRRTSSTASLEPLISTTYYPTEWAQAARAAMARYGAGRTYVNFTGDAGDAKVKSAYAPDAYRRLQQLKDRYDPSIFSASTTTFRRRRRGQASRGIDQRRWARQLTNSRSTSCAFADPHPRSSIGTVDQSTDAAASLQPQRTSPETPPSVMRGHHMNITERPSRRPAWKPALVALVAAAALWRRTPSATTPRRRRPHRPPRRRRRRCPATVRITRWTRPTAPRPCWRRPATRMSRRLRPPATPARSTLSAASPTPTLADGPALHRSKPDGRPGEHPRARGARLRVDANGDITGLVAHEYIVPIDVWTESTPPQLFGMDFHQHRHRRRGSFTHGCGRTIRPASSRTGTRPCGSARRASRSSARTCQRPPCPQPSTRRPVFATPIHEPG